MTWLSFILVALLFFMPGIDLAKIVLDNTPPLILSLPFLPVSISVQINNSIWLALCTGMAWLIIFVILIGIQMFFHFNILTELSLRNGMLFSRVPESARIICILIACFDLFLLVLRAIVLLIIGVLAIKNVDSIIAFLLGFPFGENILILSIFTLIAEAVYKNECGWQYKQSIIRNRKYRKVNQKAIAIRA